MSLNLAITLYLRKATDLPLIYRNYRSDPAGCENSVCPFEIRCIGLPTFLNTNIEHAVEVASLIAREFHKPLSPKFPKQVVPTVIDA